MTGQTLSHYHVQEKLGEGGMGVVYKGLDTRLNRPVALKLLLADEVSSPERRKRFVQEARAASALNHPNIITIYDITSHDGHDVIVMEFVEGNTLDQVLARKGLSLADTLAYSAQLADALAKAHAAGIVHRDLKPSNIMVTGDGLVKVLDFGLAKLVEAVDGGDSQANSRTVEDLAPRTDEGTIVGTAAYMSPEQAEGKKLDGRSDIFSFGSVLYEMSTGRRAFQRETTLSTLSAILRDEPKPLSELTPAAPRDLDKIIQRCLRKDPERRFQSIKDVGIALEELRKESDSRRLTALPQRQRAPGERRRLAAVAVVALLATAALALWWRPLRAPASEAWRLRQLTADSGLAATPALSLDGKFVAYSSDRASGGRNLDLWIQPLAGGAQAIRLTQDPADDTNPSFSPDGGQIAFFSTRDAGGIYVMPAFGGEERLLVRGGNNPRFSPDGRSIAYSTGTKSILGESQVFVMAAGGGAPTRIAADIPWTDSPVWSPDGQRLLVLGASGTNDWTSMEVWLVPFDGSPSVKTELLALLRDQMSWQESDAAPRLDWVGDALYFGSGSSIWTIGFRNGTLEPGTLRKLASGTTQIVDVKGTASGLVFQSRTQTTHLWSLRVDSNSGEVAGPMQPLAQAGGNQGRPSSSTDGRRLAYLQTEPGSEQLRLRDMDSGVDRVLSTGLIRPKMSPDGARIAYSLTQVSLLGPLFLMDTAGGKATKLLDPAGGLSVYGWSADGRSIVYWAGSPIGFSVFDLESRQTRELISHPTLDIHGAELSPDGHWVAFHVPHQGREPLYIAPVREGGAAGEAEWITVTTAAGYNGRPWWSSDRNLLYFLSSRDGSVCIWAQPLDSVTKRPRGEPKAVYHIHEARFSQLRNLGGAYFGPAVGGGRIVFALNEQAGNIWLAQPAVQ